MVKQTKYCQHCGKKIDKQAEICPKCGVRVKSQPTTKRIKSPGVAAVLSVIWVGLGQIYNGQIGKGIGFMILGVILFFTIFILIGLILVPLFWIYNIYDAYKTASEINEGKRKE